MCRIVTIVLGGPEWAGMVWKMFRAAADHQAAGPKKALTQKLRTTRPPDEAR